MKKSLLVASVVFAIGYTLAIAAQFAGLVSFNVFSLPVIIGGVIASGLVAVVFGDYSWRPRFRIRRSRPAAAPANVPACDWTYTTRSK